MQEGWLNLTIREEIKKELDRIKIIPDESYQTVLKRLIEGYKKHNKNAAK